MKLLIKGGTVFTMDERGTILKGADLYIDSGKISAVAPSEPPFPPQAADHIVDATDCYVLPGFVNAHTHLAYGPFRGMDEFVPGTTWENFFDRHHLLATWLSEEDYYLAVQIQIAEMFRSGITSFAEIHFEPPGALPIGDVLAQAAEACGIRGVVSTETIGWRGLGKGFTRFQFDHEIAKKTFEKSMAYAEKWHGRGGGRITAMLGLSNPPVPPLEDMRLVARGARETGLPIMVHVAEIAQEMVEWESLYGQRPMAVMQSVGILDHHVLGGNVVFLNEEDTAILRDHPFHASTCPKNCSKLALGMLDIPLMLENGVNVCLGSNEITDNNNQDMIEEARYAALYHKMKRHDPATLWGDEPIRLITERAGRALATGAGVLAAGRPADVIVMDTSGPHMHPAHDPLANVLFSSSAPADIRTVIVDGKIVMRDQKVLTFDVDAAIRKLEAKLEPLRARLPPPLEPRLGVETFDFIWERVP